MVGVVHPVFLVLCYKSKMTDFNSIHVFKYELVRYDMYMATKQVHDEYKNVYISGSSEQHTPFHVHTIRENNRSQPTFIWRIERKSLVFPLAWFSLHVDMSWFGFSSVFIFHTFMNEMVMITIICFFWPNEDSTYAEDDHANFKYWTYNSFGTSFS